MKELQSATVSIVVWAVALVLTEMRSSLLSVKMKYVCAKLNPMTARSFTVVKPRKIRSTWEAVASWPPSATFHFPHAS